MKAAPPQSTIKEDVLITADEEYVPHQASASNLAEWHFYGSLTILWLRRVPAATESTIDVGGPVVCDLRRLQKLNVLVVFTSVSFFFWACRRQKRRFLSHTKQSPKIVVSVSFIWVQQIAPFFYQKSKGVMQVSDDWFAYWRR